jgi:hypothetical protein
MIVLCHDVMPMANQIGSKLGLTPIFSAGHFTSKVELEGNGKGVLVDFDYDMIKKSARDIPQDFIFHQEQNLRKNLISFYTKEYEELIKTFPGKLIILMDKLTNIDTALFPCMTQTNTYQSGGKSFLMPAVRHFVFLHVSNTKSMESIANSLHMIIEHAFIE